MKTVCIVGASGLVGTALSRRLKTQGFRVLETSVRANPADNPDPSFESKISESDAVVNLAGAPIFGPRWNWDRKGEIYDSRILGTRHVVEAMRKTKEKYPGRSQVLVNASAVGYYGSRGDELLNEESEAGHDYLAWVVHDWEFEALAAHRTLGIRTVVLRFGVVLSNAGGALKTMLPPFRMGIGGPVGLGNQWLSWIHIDDLVDLIIFAIEKPIEGIFDAASPAPVRNKEFSHSLGKVLHRPAFLPVPELALRAAVGEAATVITSSQRVSAEKILEAGFQFKHPHLQEALGSLLG